ncbi:MAG: glycosyltransferase, partial [candidate division KSB1 bacterium]|nr:glycosyltransferase [candidate division KSB1 bacterium]
VPDAMVDWIPVAAAQMRQIIRKYQVDVVMTTSPPHSTHLLGAVLPQRRNLKWIVDLRDPWLDNAVRTHLQNVSKYRQTLESRMEKWIVHHADRVIANTEINRRVLLQRYPALCPDKLAVISNGFDAADLIPSPAFDEKPGKFVATFSGYLYQGMAEPFFRALERLLRNDPALVNRLRVQIIGHYSDYYQREIHSSPHGLAQVIQFLGPMSHRQALAQLQRSDLLLCFNFPTPAAAGVVPSKLYEYFMMAKPILAIGPEGEAAAMIRQANAGQTFTPDQENEIANAMSAFLQRWENGCLHAELNREYVQLFDRRVLTRKLAEICDALFMQ